MVLRTRAGEHVDKKLYGENLPDELFNCNQHLLPKEQTYPANNVIYCDINSLYAKCGE